MGLFGIRSCYPQTQGGRVKKSTITKKLNVKLLLCSERGREGNTGRYCHLCKCELVCKFVWFYSKCKGRVPKCLETWKISGIWIEFDIFNISKTDKRTSWINEINVGFSGGCWSISFRWWPHDRIIQSWIIPHYFQLIYLCNLIK